MVIQKRLSTEKKIKPYPFSQINYIFKDIQRIETSRGCPHNCPYCYESTEIIEWPIPVIKKNYVQIVDMNFLYQAFALERILTLGNIKVNDKKVYYECVWF